MRVAFTSCASPRMVPNQDVWGLIAQAQPDVLVLLGDNIYSDVPDLSVFQLAALSDLEFAEHLVQRYQEQLHVPGFAALVQTPGLRSYAIWDDHDFLWNDTNKAPVIYQPEHRGKMQIATSVMREFRRVLAARDVSLFPLDGGDARVWQDWIDGDAWKPLGSSSVPLEPDGRSWLHLTDGRSWRDRETLLGPVQRAALETEFGGLRSDALHVIASGSTFDQGDCWTDFPADNQWLMDRLQGRGWLMLSGDIHYNRYKVHGDAHQGRLVEATASGAAIHWLLNQVVPGKEVCNYGLLELTPDQVRVQLVAHKMAKGLHANSSYLHARSAGGSLVIAD